MTEKIYTEENSEYLKNHPTWHIEDCLGKQNKLLKYWNKIKFNLLQNNSKKHLIFYFKMFILKAVLVIKRNVMITEQIRTLEYIQEFLGYSSSSKTTEIYTHVIDHGGKGARSPADF